MIEITIIEGDGTTGTSAVIKGHSGAAAHGQDIVCAAVSAIWTVLIRGLEMLAEQYPTHIKFTRE